MPRFEICPLCNEQIITCNDISCVDCIKSGDTCNDACECDSYDIVAELQCQLIQLKIEIAHLIETRTQIN